MRIGVLIEEELTKAQNIKTKLIYKMCRFNLVFMFSCSQTALCFNSNILYQNSLHLKDAGVLMEEGFNQQKEKIFI